MTEMTRGLAFAAMTVHMQELRRIVTFMSNLYEVNPWLNDAQPKGFSSVIAMSLDDWETELQAVTEEWRALAMAQPPAPTTPQPKVWAVRMGYLETCFVERDSHVVALTAEEAQHRALAGQEIDCGTDDVQEMRESEILGLVENREPEEMREASADDLERAKNVNDDEAMRAAVSDGEAEEARTEAAGISCPVGDPECTSGEGDCHDACEAPDAT